MMIIGGSMKKDEKKPQKPAKYAIVGRSGRSGHDQMVVWADTLKEAEQRKKEMEGDSHDVRIIDAKEYLRESADY